MARRINHNVRDYQSAQEYLARGRNHDRRPLENNTYLVREGENFSVTLHGTPVVTYYPDGRFRVNSSGWQTVTTKDRINSYIPARNLFVYSSNYVWLIRDRDTGGTIEFEDNLVFSATGLPQGVVRPNRWWETGWEIGGFQIGFNVTDTFFPRTTAPKAYEDDIFWEKYID